MSKSKSKRRNVNMAKNVENIKNTKKNENLQEKVDDEKHENKKENLTIKELFIKYWDFFKDNIRKKMIILFIITIALFGIFVASYISNLDNSDFLQQIQNISDEQNTGAVRQLFTYKVPIALILIAAGITPYLYISSLGVLTSQVISSEMIQILSMPTHTQNVVLMTIGAIIQMIGFSLASANGIYWCILTGKRNKYQNSKNKSFFDVRKEFYTLKGDTKKLKQLENKKKEKLKKGEKYNVKLPIDMFIISAIISSILVILGTVIFYI